MCVICPTVTAYNPHDYRQEMETVSGFAERIHIDLMDEEFTGVHSVTLPQAWWDQGKIIDIHIMYKYPDLHLDTLKSMLPDRVIFHAEAEDNLVEFARNLKHYGIIPGVAFLQATNPLDFVELIQECEHALIFSGHLGHHGGQVDLSLLSKVEQIRQINPNIEISWDGGINESNAKQLKDGGVQVLNAGGCIQQAEDPQKAYDSLVNLVKS
ncbi:hypothetical protein H6798_03770 [Candidatus Nomurabacteria bacterium]|nr:hypothetical protein [Candidatus Nomurabacteria bacterium]